MKKRIALVLCIVMLLSMVLTGCSKSYKVETDLTNLKIQCEEKAKGGEDFEATLTPKGDYLLPEEILVRIDGSKLSAKKYTYDAETGEILIPGDEITGAIEIIAEGAELTVVGKWAATVDMSKMLNEAVAGNDATLKSICNFHDIAFDVELEFNKDGVCTMTVDMSSVNAMAGTLRTQLTDMLYEYMGIMLAETGLGISVDELLAMQGYTMDSFLDETFDVEDLLNNFTALNLSGNYEVEGDQLYMSESLSIAAKNTPPYPYVLNGNTLTIQSNGSDSDAAEYMYPMVLKRIG